MKQSLMFALLTGAALAVAPFAAVNAAGEMKKVVHDTNNHIVKNTFGNCVITKWDATMDECNNTEMLTVYFGFDSAVLTEEAYRKLDAAIEVIQGSGSPSVDVVGFADAIGANDYNYRLSQRRADAVQQYLASRGIDTLNVSVRSFGEDAPVSDCAGVAGEELKACLWRDRRVEIKLNH